MAGRAYHHGDLRAAVLLAAEAILDRGGPDALTLRGAARDAGVSHAAPAHHFGDLPGLLSALAADGFIRFRGHMLAAADAAAEQAADGGTEARRVRLDALGTGYVEFARRHPGLFQLMFRSARLDWSRPALAEAAEAAFALLTADVPDGATSGGADGFQRLAFALSRWSMVHGAALLAIDGRLDALAEAEGAEVGALLAAIVRRLPLEP